MPQEFCGRYRPASLDAVAEEVPDGAIFERDRYRFKDVEAIEDGWVGAFGR